MLFSHRSKMFCCFCTARGHSPTLNSKWCSVVPMSAQNILPLTESKENSGEILTIIIVIIIIMQINLLKSVAVIEKKPQ